MSSSNKQDAVTLGVQAGDEHADIATRPHYLPLRQLLRTHCQGPYSDIAPEFAIILRIDGDIWHWNFEGCDNLEISRRDRYISIDIGVPRSRWENTSSEALRSYLMNCVEDALQRMSGKLVLEGFAVNSQGLFSDLAKVKAEYLRDTGCEPRSLNEIGERMQCFFSDVARDASVPSSQPVLRYLSEALEEWQSISTEPGSFYGIITPNGSCVQFYREQDDGISVDVPQPTQRGSLAKRVTLEESEQIFQEIFNGTSPNQLSGLQFESW